MWRGPAYGGLIGGKGGKGGHVPQGGARPQQAFVTDSDNPLKVAPRWSPETAHYKPLSEWIVDVKVWSIACGLQESQLGPTVYRSLGGLAQDKFREIIKTEGVEFLTITREQAQQKNLQDV